MEIVTLLLNVIAAVFLLNLLVSFCKVIEGGKSEGKATMEKTFRKSNVDVLKFTKNISEEKFSGCRFTTLRMLKEAITVLKEQIVSEEDLHLKSKMHSLLNKYIQRETQLRQEILAEEQVF
jgi:hypothetical protein